MTTVALRTRTQHPMRHHHLLPVCLLFLGLASCAKHHGDPSRTGDQPIGGHDHDTNRTPAISGPGDEHVDDGDGNPSGGAGAPVPEPGTLLLVGTGLAFASGRMRRRRQSPK